ncbi:MAG: hypothetical protein GX921_04000, partial [Bacteroidales bacterium]|nr:hypothetical protein [Bacteroidales bacterium]
MKSKFSLLLIASILLTACKEKPIVDYEIIPHPNSIIYTDGSTTLTKDVKVYFTEELTQEAEMLKEYLNDDFGMTVETAQKEKNADILLELNNEYS